MSHFDSTLVLHDNLQDIWAPSMFKHLATKFIQLAASNIQGGSSDNISWTLYWTFWKNIQPKVEKRMNESNTGNSGGIFTVAELKTLVSWEWTVDCGVCFVNWLLLRLQFLTYLFCALRSENFDRFRCVGIEGLSFHYGHRDSRGASCPMVSAEYKRVKNKKGDEEMQQIGICCTCPGGDHQPITDKTIV